MFITFEGPEGSGKSSQLPALASFLKERGCDVVCTREPGGTKIGDQIRQVLVCMENVELHPRTEILLFQAARAQLVEELILPSLKQGKVVLCDRYGDSTLAYQGYGHGLDLQMLKKLLAFSTDGLYPDLTLLLDIDVVAGLQRRKQSGGEWNRLDAYAIAFHQRVREGYHMLAEEEPQRWRSIDASQTFEKVQQDLRELVIQEIQNNPRMKDI